MLDEPLTIAVLESQHLGQRPMEVIGDEGYLLVQAFEGVAYNPPDSPVSTWKVCWHSGQVTVNWSVPSLLMRR